eukprot:3966568-Pyramimonas_sp.AAC.1
MNFAINTQEEDGWSFPNITKCLFGIRVAIRHHGGTPLQWHQNEAFSLSKLNGKSECKGQRLVHSLDSFGKSYYGVLRSRYPELARSADRVYSFGHLKGRRREEAILAQCVCAARLHGSKIGRLTTLYDATNAFHSVEHEYLHAYVDEHCDAS